MKALDVEMIEAGEGVLMEAGDVESMEAEGEEEFTSVANT